MARDDDRLPRNPRDRQARGNRDSDTGETMRDTSTEGIQIGSSGSLRRRTGGEPTIAGDAPPRAARPLFEAAIIIIAHPENRRLGTRFRLTPGTALEIGRAPGADVSLPEVPSLSRNHARLAYGGERVTLSDLGSRNGTFVNDRRVEEDFELRSGDRFQVGAVHFKFLHERDVEHAYYEAIYEMVVRDGLTGTFNRRKFVEEASREIVRAQRYRRPLSLILVDIDGFKQINDTYGHLAGDALLKQLAARFESRVRQEELFARLGGEEFAILSPETDLEGAAAHAESIRALCAETPFDLATGSPVAMSCSFGVAELAPAMARVEDLLRAADAALYEAKEKGRNRVAVAPRRGVDDTTGAGT